MEATETIPILTWNNAATPLAAVLAVGVLIAILTLPILLYLLNAIRAHLRATRIHIRESRDWLRRNAADERTAQYHTLVFKPHLLTRHLDYLERQSAATLQDIRQAKAEDPEVIDALHSLLDYFEGLARAINHGVLSERVVRAAHQHNMGRALRIFRPYIEQHRSQSSADAWTGIESIVTKWEGAEAPASLPANTPHKRAA